MKLIEAGSLYLSKINGGAISETEARNIMDGHGPIEMLWFATHTEREMFGLPEGIFVRFAFFDDCRDAVAVSFLADENCACLLMRILGFPRLRSLSTGASQRS